MMTRSIDVADAHGPVRRDVRDAAAVAARFGLPPQPSETTAGQLPFPLHNHLCNSGDVSPDAFTLSSVMVRNKQFFWVEPSTDWGAWQRVGLRGHRIISDGTERKSNLVGALKAIFQHPGAIDLVIKFVTTFAFVEQYDDGSGERRLTSCSLPDFPLIAFISDYAMRHIPPLSVAAAPSVRLMAENIYHEAVHQYVNYRLITEDFLVQDYDSRTSPKVPIFWRAGSAKRNQAWELDRVLHAATVYVQLLEWRRDELIIGGLSEQERECILAASRDAVASATFLVGALMDHLHFFTPEGALFLGRLSQAAEHRSKDLLHVLGAAGSIGA